MKLRIIFLIAAVFASQAQAQQRPQDYWHYLRSFCPGNGIASHTGIAAGNGKVYVGAYPSSGSKSVQIYTETGELLGTFGSFTSINGIAVAPGGDVLVFDGGARKFKLYSGTGTFIREWGTAGSDDGAIGTAALASYNGVAIDAAGEVYFADAGNYRIQVFDLQGNFLRKWGKQGSLPDEFSNRPVVVAVTPEGRTYTTDGKVYTRLGEYIERHSKIGASTSVGVTKDGLVIGGLTAAKGDSSYGVVDPQIQPQFPTSGIRGVCFGSDDKIYALFGNISDAAQPRVWVFARGYYQGYPTNVPAVPAPSVSAEQRPSTTLVDIDFNVWDADSEHVRIAPLAFVGESQDFSAILPMRTFVEGTETKVGLVATSQTHRLTWNAAADWDEDFGDARIEILARDEVDLLGMHLIKFPAQGADPEVLVSREPVSDARLLPIWHWLIATGDTNVSLQDGRVMGSAGAYSGNVLAKGVVTTDRGRQFLYEKLNIRPLTSAERARAIAGQYGFKSVSFQTVARGWIAPLNIVGWGKGIKDETTFGVFSSVQKVATGYINEEDVTTVLSGGALTHPDGSFSEGYLDVSVGWSHYLWLRSDETVSAYCDYRNDATEVPHGLTGVKAVAAGMNISLALKNNGTVVRWGQPSVPSLDVPAGLNNVTAIAAGRHCYLALKQDGTVVFWGADVDGGKPPQGLSGVVAIAAGDSHYLALKSDGTVVAWGRGFFNSTAVPPGLSGVVEIAAGSYHCLALKRDGTVVAWGRNDEGQCSVPAGLNNVIKLGSGVEAYHSVVVQQTH